MIRAVIFDMYETLITHFQSPLYFGSQIARDAGIAEENFQPLWQQSEYDRSIGRASLEEVLKTILTENHCFSETLLYGIIQKRMEVKRDCFRHLHSEILPMFSKLREMGILTGLISNCFSEEVTVIRESVLFPYFDAVFLSYEQGIAKPDEEIFMRCMKQLSVKPEECLYVGDGGSYELETARKLGMTALQAAWYLKDGTTQPAKRKPDFPQLEKPFDVFAYISNT